ncbi:MAG TPA: CvpA family protein [Thermodesulfobacteriota bacterium]|nr:CvpA family protein [Thermodesulfobacteriota bacterium]
MNTLDIIFLLLIGASVLYSLIRGLVREIFSFLSIIFGFFGASYGYSSVAHWLKRWITNETMAQIVAFAVLFIVIALAIGLLGRVLSRLIHKGGLGWADRLGGAAFGFLKAILLAAILVLVLTAFLPQRSAILLESKVSAAALAISRGLSFLVPEKFRDLYARKEKELKKYWATQEFSVGKKIESKGTKKP